MLSSLLLIVIKCHQHGMSPSSVHGQQAAAGARGCQRIGASSVKTRSSSSKMEHQQAHVKWLPLFALRLPSATQSLTPRMDATCRPKERLTAICTSPICTVSPQLHAFHSIFHIHSLQLCAGIASCSSWYDQELLPVTSCFAGVHASSSEQRF